MSSFLTELLSLSNLEATATIGTAAAAALGFIIRNLKKKRKQAELETVNPTVSQTGGDNSTLVNATNSQVTVNTHHHAAVPAQPAEVVDILGKWDLPAAQRLAEKLLQPADWVSLAPGVDKPYAHEFIDEYHPHYADKEGIVLAYSTKTEGDECHACAPYVSFFEFHRKATGWSMVNDSIGTFQGGGWGSPPTISIMPISRSKFAVIQVDGSTHQGLSVCRKTVHIPMGDRFQQVLELIVGQSLIDETEREKGWDTTLKTIPRSDNYYDIEAIRTGINGEQDLRLLDDVNTFYTTLCDSDDRIRPRDFFSFDGRQYNRDPAIR